MYVLWLVGAPADAKEWQQGNELWGKPGNGTKYPTRDEAEVAAAFVGIDGEIEIKFVG